MAPPEDTSNEVAPAEDTPPEDTPLGESSDDLDTVDPEWLRAQVAMLKKVVLILLVICLVTSVCVNVYVVGANASIRFGMRDYAALTDRTRANDLFIKRLIMDLQFLSKDNDGVRTLLVKYNLAAPAPDALSPAGPIQ